MDDIEVVQMDDTMKSRALMAGGLSFVGTGLGLIVTMAVRRRRGLVAWLVPGALIAFGLALLGAAAAGRYGSHIEETEQAVREQLSQVDPFARVKILKDLAEEQVPAWMKRQQEEAVT